MYGLIIPGLGFAPYANSCGIKNLYFEPTVINCKPSVQPFITWVTPNSDGVPLSTELSKTVPSTVVPW